MKFHCRPTLPAVPTKRMAPIASATKPSMRRSLVRSQLRRRDFTFRRALLDRIRERGVHIAYVTLHVGLATFAPVKIDEIAQHIMHEETFELSRERRG